MMELEFYGSFRPPENTCHPGFVATKHRLIRGAHSFSDEQALHPASATSAQGGDHYGG